MQPSHTARLAAAIALAFAASAHAATAVKAATASGSTAASATTASGASAPVMLSNNGTVTRSSTAVPTAVNPAPASTTTTTSTTTTPTPQNTTTVDLRNLQTQAAVAGTHASGSTSALGPFANGTVTNSTAGTGTTSGAGATGTGSSTGTGTTTTTGNGAFGTIGGASVIGGGALVGSNGVITIPAGNPSDVTIVPAGSGQVLAQNLAASDVNAGAVLIPDANAPVSAANGVSVDRAINQVSRDRKRVGRNGQLLYSVAPRTNVDRTWQMPDDGPSPALTGSNSTLTR